MTISFSAFFADLGYQMIQAIFPIYLVIALASSPLYLGIANALAFGGGALFAYVGGILGDRYSRKWIAVIGSGFILLMSAVGLTMNPIFAIALFAGGWWGRNMRVAPRRALLASASDSKNRGKAFGFLHALDIGGGLLAVVVLIFMLYLGVSESHIFFITALPLLVSTYLLMTLKDVRAKPANNGNGKSKRARINKRAYNGIILATALYGFSYYSLGFPILTIAKMSGNSVFGIASYGVYLGVSAVTGYYIGSRKRMKKIRSLGLLGYMLSGVGTFLLALGYIFNSAIILPYIGVAMMGFGLGVIETLEPTIISLMKSGISGLGKSLGKLSASRSFGIFFANLLMGILYVVNPSYSYIYAAVVSISAGIIVIAFGRNYDLIYDAS